MINFGGGTVTIGADIKQLKSALKDGERAMKGFGQAGAGMQRAASVSFQGVGKGADIAAKAIEKGWSQIERGFAKGYKVFRGPTTSFGFDHLGKGLLQGLGTIETGIEKAMLKISKAVGQGLVKNGPDIGKGLLKGVSASLDGLGKVASVAMHRVHAVVVTGVNGAASAFSTLTRAAASAFGAIASKATGIFRGIARTIHGALTSTFTQIIAAFSAMSLAQKTSDAIHGIIGSAIDLESQFSKVRKTTGIAGDELVKFRSRIEGIARSMGGVKLADLLDISVMGGRLGVASKDLERFTRDIAMITVALDDIPAEEAATSIGRILNVFNLGADNAIRFASALNKLDDTSTATGRDILDITRRLSGPASVLGLSPQKVLALSAALKDAGVANEVAGTAMSQVLAKMATESNKFAIVAGKTNAAFRKMITKDPLVALNAFISGFRKLDAITQYDVLDSLKLKGARVGTTLMQLSRVMPKLTDYVKSANSEWTSLNSILAENEIQSQTAKAQLTRMWNSIEILSGSIGEALLPLVKTLANSFLQLSTDSQKFWDSIKDKVGDKLQPVLKWAERLSVLFQKWPDFAALAGIEFEEKMTNAITITKNLFSTLGEFLQDLFGQLGDTISVLLANGIKRGIAKGIAGMTGNGALGGFLGGGIFGGDAVAGALGGGAMGALNEDKVPAIAPKTGLFTKKGLLADTVDRSGEKQKHLDNIDKAVGAAAEQRQQAANANKPQPAAPAKPKLPALQELNDQNMERGIAPFRGTEAQAQRILGIRKRRETENQGKSFAKAAQNTDALVGLGFADPMQLGIAKILKNAGGGKSHARKSTGRRVGGYWEQFDTLMGIGGDEGEGRPKPKTKAEFHGLEDFAKMTQTGALNQEDYQRKMLSNSDKQTQYLESLLHNAETMSPDAGAGP